MYVETYVIAKDQIEADVGSKKKKIIKCTDQGFFSLLYEG